MWYTIPFLLIIIIIQVCIMVICVFEGLLAEDGTIEKFILFVIYNISGLCIISIVAYLTSIRLRCLLFHNLDMSLQCGVCYEQHHLNYNCVACSQSTCIKCIVRIGKIQTPMICNRIVIQNYKCPYCRYTGFENSY